MPLSDSATERNFDSYRSNLMKISSVHFRNHGISMFTKTAVIISSSRAENSRTNVGCAGKRIVCFSSLAPEKLSGLVLANTLEVELTFFPRARTFDDPVIAVARCLETRETSLTCCQSFSADRSIRRTNHNHRWRKLLARAVPTAPLRCHVSDTG